MLGGGTNPATQGFPFIPVAICKPGVPYQQIGRVIEERAKADGFCVSEMFIGHGIGRAFHTAPNVFHHTNDMDEGLTVCLSPPSDLTAFGGD